MMRRWAAFLSLAFCLLWSCFPGQASAEPGWEEKFHDAVSAWIKSLAESDPRFQDWAEAPYEAEPLGPNSKQWLVLIRTKGDGGGYLVVGETPAGELSLLEYGLAGIPLFAADLIRLYHPELDGPESKTERIYQGLQSFFRVQIGEKTQLIDAKTGESIPDPFVAEGTGDPEEEEVPPIHPEKLIFSYLKPLSGWEERFPVQAFLYKREGLDGLGTIMTKETFYEGRTWNGNIKLLLEVKGYHQWSGGVIFIALEQEGYRFLPLKNKTDGGKLPSVSFEQLFIVKAGAAAPERLVRQTSLPH